MSVGNFYSKGAETTRFKAAWRTALLCAALLATICENAGSLRAQSMPVTAGYRDFYFAKSVNGLLTGEKPQSKLWWNDGIWWGCLWDVSLKKYTIHRFNLATQSWTNTGIAIDSRVDSKGDALWDGQHLYYLSQHYTNTAGPAASGDEGKLYRYSYNAAAKTYSLDAGFPVIVNNSIAETLVLAKDSTGKLWVTWTEGGKVKVNRSLGNDLTWGTPFDLPVQGTNAKIDDISSILAFGGNKIGIMWSNQNDKKSYFAVHLDGNADEVWEPKEQALADAALGAVSYDHINLKPSCDNEGNVYAATKTNMTQSGLPLVYLLRRTAAGVWTRYLVSTVDEGYIRPIVLIDGTNHKIYVFATCEATSHRSINMKSSDLSNIAFPAGLGTPFIQSDADTMIMNPTSTKQCLNSATGLLVLAADQHTRTYLHNYLDLSGGAPQFTLTANTAPQGGGSVALNPPGGVYNSGTVVTLTATPASGFQFSGWSGDLSGSTNPVNITMNAHKNVTATFTPQYTLTVNLTGSGNVALDPPGGVYNPGTVVTLTATPVSGFQFSGWSGNLSGSTNPVNITMNANKNVTATFIENGVVHKETQIGSSSNLMTVTSASLTGASDHLYLAAIATRAKVKVNSVSGLGLTWALVKAQCAGQNTTGIEVWKAHGTPSGNGAVTATFASAPVNAVIAVSRYSGVAAANPIGNIISGNTNGANATCTGGVNTNAYSFNLTTTVEGALAYGAATMRGLTHAPGADYTERAEILHGSSGATTSVAVEDKSVASASTVAVNGTFSGTVDWAMVGLEIMPQGAAPTQYTLTVNTAGSGSVALNPPGGTYDAGTVVTLTATPASGFQFDGWSGALSGSTNPTTITMNANKSVTATFTTMQRTLTVNTVGSGSVALNPAGGVYNNGAVVTLTATPIAGFQFSGWSGDLSGATNPAMMTMNANKSVTATFTASGGNPNTNLAHNKTVTASSSYSGKPPINVVDGSTSTYWRNGGSVSSSNPIAWLRVDLGAVMLVGRAVVRWKENYFAKSYELQVSNDDVNWTKVYSTTAGNSGSQQFVFPQTTARYVRFYMTQNSKSNYQIYELELYSSASAAAKISGDALAVTALPEGFTLRQNYPNPFSSEARSRFAGNPGTLISFTLPEAGKVTLNIYSETGQLVRTLVDGEMATGRHLVHWNGRNEFGQIVAAGMYFYRMVVRGEDGAAAFAQTRRMMFLK